MRGACHASGAACPVCALEILVGTAKLPHALRVTNILLIQRERARLLAVANTCPCTQKIGGAKRELLQWHQSLFLQRSFSDCTKHVRGAIGGYPRNHPRPTLEQAYASANSSLLKCWRAGRAPGKLLSPPRGYLFAGIDCVVVAQWWDLLGATPLRAVRSA